MSYVKTACNLIAKKPILVIFDVTRLCNQRCRMCNIWREKSEDMPLARIEEKAAELSRFGVGYVFLQGGEPTVRADLAAIVDIFLNHGIKPTVITNGILLKDELAMQLAERQCNVAISLDTLNAENFAYIRGVPMLDTVKANIEKAFSIKNRRGNWSVTTTVTELATIEEIKALESFANGNGFMYAIRPYVHTIGTAGKTDDALAYRDPDRIAEIFEYMLGKARVNNYLANLIYEEHINYVKGKTQPMCDALCRSMVMSPKGDFAPCIEFADESAPLDEMLGRKKEWHIRCAECNRATPCFYNDVREIGVLWRKKWRAAAAIPKIIAQMKRYGNFF